MQCLSSATTTFLNGNTILVTAFLKAFMLHIHHRRSARSWNHSGTFSVHFIIHVAPHRMELHILRSVKYVSQSMPLPVPYVKVLDIIFFLKEPSRYLVFSINWGCSKTIKILFFKDYISVMLCQLCNRYTFYHWKTD